MSFVIRMSLAELNKMSPLDVVRTPLMLIPSRLGLVESPGVTLADRR